ncbi:MAG: VWA domain-containing protein [Myxococcota bacterium]|nr:VWA domain-containing protein [Myxococcota bacterium]
MTFALPYVLILVPLVAFLPWWGRHSSLSFSSLRGMSARKTWRVRLAWLPSLLASMGLICLTLALARPHTEKREQVIEKEGLDIILVVDTSGSMAEEDYELQGRRVSRMEVSKSVMQTFIEGRPSDRIGLVVFGEEAFTQCPLTIDHEGMIPFLNQIQIGVAGESATAIGDAIAIGTQRLKDLDAPSKVLILLTDGQSNTGSDPIQMAQAAGTLGIKIYTIGIGGGLRKGLFGLLGAPMLDDAVLQSVAQTTGGVFYQAQSTRTLQEVYKEIDTLEPTTAEYTEYILREEHFQYFVYVALVFLLAHVLLSQTILRRLP